MDKLFHCEDCKKTFTARSSLNVHIRKFHPDKVNTLKPLKCITCGLKCSSKQELKNHELQVKHPAVNSEKSKMMSRCPLCEYILIRSKLIDHIQASHNTIIEKETFNLATMNDFETWKENLEETTKASFIKRSTPYFGRSCTKTLFLCHRSGSYKSMAKGVKRLKTQGSNKINAHCPAEIKLIQRGEQCEVEFVKTHLGHENCLNHLWLSKKDKDEIAAKMAAKIPINTILDEIRDNTDTSNLKRIDIITRTDLNNIKKSYNLKSTKSDATSVEAWVNEVEENNKRLDVAISTITRFSRNKLLEQAIIMDKDPECNIMQEIPESSSSATENQSDFSEDSFVLEKQKIERYFQELLQMCTSTDDLRIIRKMMRPIKPTIEAAKRQLKEFTAK